MPTTPVQALPYPALSDPANGPIAVQNLALALEDYKTLVRCTSSTRPAHVEGRVIYETDTDTLAVSTGSAWRILDDSRNTTVLPDVNVTAVFQGCEVHTRGRMATLTLELSPNLSWSSTWSLIQPLPVGYRPSRRHWFQAGVVQSSDTAWTLRLDVDGGVFCELNGIPAGTNLIGSVAYALA